MSKRILCDCDYLMSGATSFPIFFIFLPAVTPLAVIVQFLQPTQGPEVFTAVWDVSASRPSRPIKSTLR